MSSKGPCAIGMSSSGAEVARARKRRAEIAIAQKDWCQAAQDCRAILDAIQSEPESAYDESLFAIACTGLMRSHDYDRVIAAVLDLKRRVGESKFLLTLEGLAYLRSLRIETARTHWADFWQKTIKDRSFANQRQLLIPPNHGTNYDGFPTPIRNDFFHKGVVAHFCVYTALFGEYDELRPLLYVPPGLKFICFSDRPRDVLGWDVRIIDPVFDDPILNNRIIKILPYDYLNEYDLSLYIDANVCFLGDPLVLYHHWLKNERFAAWCHPRHACVYDELELILASSRSEPFAILDQYVYFAKEGVPAQIGLIEASFLWRDHRDNAVRALMEQCWDHLLRFGSRRDQPGFAYLMWKTGPRPSVLPKHLGSSLENEFFRKFDHKQTVLQLEQNDASDSCRVNERVSYADNAKRKHWRQASPLGLQRKRLGWVCREKFRCVASTLMRGYQLSELARFSLSDAQVSYINESQLHDQFDSVLILTKGFLKGASLDELSALKKRGNLICADYVDDRAREDLHECVDVYIASSITQFVHYSRNYADKLVHLITHHAEPRLNGTRGPEDYCRIGYFGEIVNARYSSELQGIIDFCPIRTDVVETSWIPRLSSYNVHYAVRNRRTLDGFKPFLKGFTAAQCHSNILVRNDESDVRYYLGSDYPYILTDDTLNSVLEMIGHAKTSFGGPEWHRGLEIMESVRQRCAPKQIESELRALLARFW